MNAICKILPALYDGMVIRDDVLPVIWTSSSDF